MISRSSKLFCSPATVNQNGENQRVSTKVPPKRVAPPCQHVESVRMSFHRDISTETSFPTGIELPETGSGEVFLPRGPSTKSPSGDVLGVPNRWCSFCRVKRNSFICFSFPVRCDGSKWFPPRVELEPAESYPKNYHAHPTGWEIGFTGGSRHTWPE